MYSEKRAILADAFLQEERDAEMVSARVAAEGVQMALAAELEAEKRRMRKALDEAGARMDDCKERLAQACLTLPFPASCT